MLYQPLFPISRQDGSRDYGCEEEKITLPGVPRSFSKLIYVTIKSTSQLRNINHITFHEHHQKRITKDFPAVQGRLTHVQMLFTWNPSPLQSSKFSVEYLLLPPRSALGTVSLRFAPKLHNNSNALLHACSKTLTQAAGFRRPASAPSIFGASPFGR